ncbi:hypothetical protein BGZ83_005257 [Gryganskiella cystojenkinii]|nr:hypothetical protein BGZ83_005257 [Gryganskiella cystojenkinii]
MRRPRNPLDIPEIISSVGPFLNRNSLVTCLRVSKVWYSLLFSILWSDLQIVTPEFRVNPPFELVRKHAALIRKIRLNNDVEPTLRDDLYCPNLLHLTIVQFHGRGDPTFSFRELVARHVTTLEVLETNQHLSKRHLEVIARCRNLKRLEHLRLRLKEHSEQWLEVYSQLWSRLTALSVAGPWYQPSARRGEPELTYVHPSEESLRLVTERVGPAKIRDLNIENSRDNAENIEQAHFWVIKQCQDLIRLRWVFDWDDKDNGHGPMGLIAEAIQTGHRWDQLEALALRNVSFWPEDLVLLLETTTHLKELGLVNSDFDLDSWEHIQASTLARTHFSALTVFDVSDCSYLPGSVIQAMLCSMPELRVFRANEIADTDILKDDRPWVCRQLRELILLFSILESRTSSPSPSQLLILQRLAQLNQLEKFESYDKFYGQGENESIQLTFVDGLDQLRTLRRMKHIRVLTCDAVSWGKEEVHWVLEHWPELETLTGFNMNPDAGALLRRKVFVAF